MPCVHWNMNMTAMKRRELQTGPVVLPNVHEAVANRRAQRAEKRAAFDIALDDEPDSPAIPELVIQAVPDGEQETEQQEEVTADPPPLYDILALFENRETVMQENTAQKQETQEAPPWEEETKPRAKQEKTEKISEDEQAVMNAQMDENQKAPLMVYEHPPVDLLESVKGRHEGQCAGRTDKNSQRLVDTLESFGIEAKIIGIVRGPSVTRF